MKLRQEISFIDSPATAGQADKIIYLDPANYSDAVWCVEVVAKVDSGSMTVQFLRATEGGVHIGNGACTFTETTPTLKQSGTFEIPEPSIGELNEFSFRLDGTFTGGVVYQAKLVAYQTGNYVIYDPDAVAPRVGIGLLYNYHCWVNQAKYLGMLDNGLRWRVPNQTDWNSLRTSLGGGTLSGKRAKSCRMPGYPGTNGGACDTSTWPYWSYNATFWGDDLSKLAMLPNMTSGNSGVMYYYWGAYFSGTFGSDGTVTDSDGVPNNDWTMRQVFSTTVDMGGVEYGHDISNWWIFRELNGVVAIRLCRTLLPDETSLANYSWGPKYIDYEGNEYRTVKIGSYMWLAEGLRTTHFSDGTEIPFMASNAARSGATGAGCTSNNGTTITDAVLGIYEDHWPYGTTYKDTPDIAITETVINIGNRETGKLNTVAEPLIYPKYWQYDGAYRDGTKSHYVEAWVYPTAKVGVTVVLQVDNGSLSSWSTVKTILSAVTGDQVYYARTTFTPSTLTPYRTYRIVCYANTNKYPYDFIGANIIVRQLNGTIFRIYNHMGSYGDIGGSTGVKNFLALFRRKDYMTGTTNPSVFNLGFGVASGTAAIRVTSVQAVKRVQNYGVLYNYAARVDSRRLTSYGYRLPNYTDLYYLRAYFEQILLETDATKLKSCRMVDSSQGGSCTTSDHPRWNTGGAEGTDDFGFGALPAGNIGVGNNTLDNLGVNFTLGSTDVMQGFPDSTYALVITNAGNFSWVFIGQYNGAFTTRPLRWCTQTEYNEVPDGTIMEDYIGNDQRVYKTVKIGFHVITTEDLKETMFRDGSWVPIADSLSDYSALGSISKGYIHTEGGQTLTSDTSFDWETNTAISTLIERESSSFNELPTDIDYEALLQLEVTNTGTVNGSALVFSFSYSTPPIPPSWISGILKYYNDVSEQWEAPPVKIYQLGIWADVTPKIPE